MAHSIFSEIEKQTHSSLRGEVRDPLCRAGNVISSKVKKVFKHFLQKGFNLLIASSLLVNNFAFLPGVPSDRQNSRSNESTGNYVPPQFSHPEPRMGERPDLDVKLQQPIAERHILVYQPLASPINLYWSSAGVTNVYVPIQRQHAQWIVGVVITQPAGGSGTMAIQLGDTWWPPLWIDPSITQKAYIADPSVWPPDKQNLYTASEKQNGDNYLAEDYAGVSSAVYNGVLRFPVQSSWANGLRFQYYLYGGLGRPSGQLLGYVYLGDGIPNESLLSPYCSPSET